MPHTRIPACWRALEQQPHQLLVAYALKSALQIDKDCNDVPSPRERTLHSIDEHSYIILRPPELPVSSLRVIYLHCLGQDIQHYALCYLAADAGERNGTVPIAAKMRFAWFGDRHADLHFPFRRDPTQVHCRLYQAGKELLSLERHVLHLAWADLVRAGGATDLDSAEALLHLHNRATK